MANVETVRPSLVISGMGGHGDCIRQRAIVRAYMQSHNVWLESPSTWMYHDLIDDGLKVIRKQTSLRTQEKNAERESDRFSNIAPPAQHQSIRINYPPKDVRRYGSVLAAMCLSARLDPVGADFRMPVPAEWRTKARSLVQTDRPILIYRPLVDRPSDWGGCKARNPDHAAYAELFNSIRDRFYVVSVADLLPGKEWIVGHEIEADAEFHKGELEFEALAGLTAEAALVYCSPGFAGVLAQAVGTPVAMVFGGYERSKFFFDGAKDAPVLGIDPINPCECFSHNHRCQKEINVPPAKSRLAVFSDKAIERHNRRAESGLERVA